MTQGKEYNILILLNYRKKFDSKILCIFSVIPIKKNGLNFNEKGKMKSSIYTRSLCEMCLWSFIQTMFVRFHLFVSTTTDAVYISYNVIVMPGNNNEKYIRLTHPLENSCESDT